MLYSGPVGESDRRLTLLTGELGKISAFARGARRPGSSLMAAMRPFTYGQFELYQGRDAYTMDAISDARYFDHISKDLESSCYGTYFMEMLGYYGHEALEAYDMVNLGFASLLALEKKLIPCRLIRAIFELKLLYINGEYWPQPRKELAPGAVAAWQYVLSSSYDKLFSFNLEGTVMKQFCSHVDELRDYYIDRKFKSLEVLESLL